MTSLDVESWWRCTSMSPVSLITRVTTQMERSRAAASCEGPWTPRASILWISRSPFSWTARSPVPWVSRSSEEACSLTSWLFGPLCGAPWLLATKAKGLLPACMTAGTTWGSANTPCISAGACVQRSGQGQEPNSRSPQESACGIQTA
ncbi:hypothetical protein DUNSADRAFT_14873 [Dunaliella salina]|uniref:Encoded protein n=1 Tax=Dunaliella salina TaxID=3046 RepID=A0ABQ7G6I9_DUNSA|nr:hypothetical protein DUNSADRAFT_14873 [Dunaliella salina]|eukprot:KAF5830231.1 hypothetical protein DUNSADRAFT_14873 [Dunaliella salina]